MPDYWSVPASFLTTMMRIDYQHSLTLPGKELSLPFGIFKDANRALN